MLCMAPVYGALAHVVLVERGDWAVKVMYGPSPGLLLSFEEYYTDLCVKWCVCCHGGHEVADVRL
ncbi:hypothetical protein Taro_016575 [Colocasia esculenta]|uniref:Uncharacterized protein n=1 Tax=Colocasia esculenta TaxID=4460 RepID=A0A843UL31_COLES|nr:hypothetical protein [Colocasia esculenta]